MEQQITNITVRQFVGQVSHQNHAMAGAVIAASAAQAVALGTACMQISLNSGLNEMGRTSVSETIREMSHIRDSLLQWCDRDATAIAEYVALREAGNELRGRQLLCESPADIARLSLEAAAVFQDFRAGVIEKVQDDLEMALVLLTGTARAAMLLLDSNLRIWIWPQPALPAQFDPILLNLEQRLNQLTPLNRIRPKK